MKIICEKCKEKPAVVHMEKIINGHRTECNLCAECAEGHEENPSLDDLMQNFISMMFSANYPYTKTKADDRSELRCDKCGLTYDQFKQTNKLGCDKCYTVFRNQLDLIFKNIQKNSVHTGKYPSRVNGEIVFERKLNKLKTDLEKAIAEEEYEQAAVLRDTIKELQETKLSAEE